MLPTLAATIHQIDPDIATAGEATMNDEINNSQSAYLHRSSAWLVGGFAAAGIAAGRRRTLRSGCLLGEPENA